jgi:hypothetical protein
MGRFGKFGPGDRVRVRGSGGEMSGNEGVVDDTFYIGRPNEHIYEPVRVLIDGTQYFFHDDELALIDPAKPATAGIYTFKVETFDEIDLARVCREAEPGTDAILVTASKRCVWGLAKRAIGVLIPGLPYRIEDDWYVYKLFSEDSTDWFSAVQKARAQKARATLAAQPAAKPITVTVKAV